MTKRHPVLNRPISACLRCRGAKLGCDKSKPRCQRCVRLGADCTYSSQTQSPEGGRSDDDIARNSARRQTPEELDHGTSSESPPERQPHVPARRDRAIISCVRCRKHKVRCDRKAPCDRCTRLNKGSECVYFGGSSAKSYSIPVDQTKTIATTYVDEQWHHRFRTPAHWTTLLYEVRCLCPPPHGGRADAMLDQKLSPPQQQEDVAARMPQ